MSLRSMSDGCLLLQAVAPVGVTLFKLEKLQLPQ